MDVCTSPCTWSRRSNLGLPYYVWATTGEIHIGGQEHFYLETNCTLAVPRGEDGEMELFVSTQAATKTQVSHDWVS